MVARWSSSVFTILPILVASIVSVASVVIGGDAVLSLPDPLVPGARLNATITVNDPPAQVRRVEMPAVDGLTWGEPRSAGFQQTIINGVSSSTQRILIEVQAAREGRYTVPAITLHLVNKTTMATAPVTVTAAPGDNRLSGNGLVEARFEPEAVVPGEPAALVLKVATADRQPIEPGLKPPEGSISLGEMTKTEGTSTAADGREWNVVTFRWPLAFGKPGAYQAAGQQQIYTNVRQDLFGQLRGNPAQLPIKPARITVAELPEQGRPDDFAGLVGAITTDAKLERDRIALGEGVGLELTVSGRQIDLARQPRLDLPKGLTGQAKQGGDVTEPGRRIFRWQLWAEAPGTYQLPVFSFSWFDPASRTYRRSQTAPVTLTVLPGRSIGLNVAGRQLSGATAPTIAAPTTGPQLPLPWRGAAPARPGDGWALIAAAGSAAIALIAGSVLRFAGRSRPRPHRGRALKAAVASGGIDAIANAAAAFADATLEPAQRAAIDRLIAAADGARFGGAKLPAEAAAWAATVADVP